MGEEEGKSEGCFWTAGYQLLFRSLENRTMEGCPHSQSVNAKDCMLCRVKRVVCINQRTPVLRKIPRHRTQECLPAMPKKQSHISSNRYEKSVYKDGGALAETNYSRWLKKIQQKIHKAPYKLKPDHTEIDWSLFDCQKHRTRFDRWQSKLVLRLAKRGHWQDLMRNMSLF